MSPMLTRLLVLPALAAGLLLLATGCPNDNESSSSNSPTIVYQESFTGSNGSSLPSEWMEITTSRVNSSIQDNAAHLQHDAPPIVARVVSTTLDVMNFELTYRMRFEDFANQGIGFYGRQNGGHLMTTTPPGQGYVIFTEGALGASDFGFWEEVNGVETRVFGVAGPLVAGGIQNATWYRVRFRVTQQGGSSTLLQAKIWPDGDSEPTDWTAEYTSSTGVLQNLSGGFALDLYNYSGSAGVDIDDIEITDLGN